MEKNCQKLYEGQKEIFLPYLASQYSTQKAKIFDLNFYDLTLFDSPYEISISIQILYRI